MIVNSFAVKVAQKSGNKILRFTKGGKDKQLLEKKRKITYLKEPRNIVCGKGLRLNVNLIHVRNHLKRLRLPARMALVISAPMTRTMFLLVGISLETSSIKIELVT